MSVNPNTITTVPSTNLFVPQALGRLTVQHNGREFFVIDAKNVKSSVSRGDLSPELRGMSKERLEKVLSVGYLAVRKVGNDYALRFHNRLPGGGPFLALVAYVGTNVAGGVMVAAGTVLAPTGVGAALIGAGVATITAAPYTLVATLPTPTP